MNQRVVVIDDQVTPYRIPFFQKLYQRLPGLEVLYCSKRFQERSWSLPDKLGYPHHIIPSLQVRSIKPPYDQWRTTLIPTTLFPELIRYNPGIVVGYAFSIPTWIAFMYTRLFRKRFISWSTDTLHTERYYGFLQRSSRKLIVPKANACITPSTSGAEKFISYGADPAHVKVVVQSPDVDFFISESDRVRRRNLYHPARCCPDGFWLLYVGFLAEHKGLKQLLHAFSIVQSRIPSAHLILAGDGPLVDWIIDFASQNAMSENVHLTGYVSQADLPRLYASADLFVFPSLEDTFGVVVAEAAACGLPILSSIFAGATSEYIRDGENGFAIDPTDEQELAKKIVHLLKKPALRKAMSSASRDIALKNHPDRSVEDFLEALLIASSPL